MDSQMDNADALCRNINTLRREKSVAQDSLAEKLDVTPRRCFNTAIDRNDEDKRRAAVLLRLENHFYK